MPLHDVSDVSPSTQDIGIVAPRSSAEVMGHFAPMISATTNRLRNTKTSLSVLRQSSDLPLEVHPMVDVADVR